MISKVIKLILMIYLIAFTKPQCTGITVTDADNTAMTTWATTTVNNGLTSSLDCTALSSCTLKLNFPTPNTSIDPKLTYYVNFVAADLTTSAQTYTSSDLNGIRTLSVLFSAASIQTFKPITATSANTITYSLPVNLLLVNKCLSMGLATINGNIVLSINSLTNTLFSTRSSMLQSNIPSCTPACTVSTTFFLNQAVCDTSACTTVSSSKNYKLGDVVYLKAILPDALKTLKFKLFQATYAVLGQDGSNVFQSENIFSKITEVQNSGYNILSWAIPVATEVVGTNGQYTGNVRTISLNMFFVLVTSREVRYLQTTTTMDMRLLQTGGVETSQPVKVAINLDSTTSISGSANVSSNKTNTSDSKIAVLGLLFAMILSLLF
jgi:hypothetical protein